MTALPHSVIQHPAALRARGNSGAATGGPRALWRDRSGGTLIWFALTVPVMLGMSGLGVDAALWYMDRRIMQTASDSGAIAAAHVLAQGGEAPDDGGRHGDHDVVPCWLCLIRYQSVYTENKTKRQEKLRYSFR